MEMPCVVLWRPEALDCRVPIPLSLLFPDPKPPADFLSVLRAKTIGLLGGATGRPSAPVAFRGTKGVPRNGGRK